MKRVLVTETMHPCGLEILAGRDDIEVVHLEGDIRPETLLAHMPGVHAIAARSAELTADILNHANELEVISRHGVGCDLIDVEYVSGRGIPVAIASGANSLSVAEHTMALMMAHFLSRSHAMVDSGRPCLPDGTCEGPQLLPLSFTKPATPII